MAIKNRIVTAISPAERKKLAKQNPASHPPDRPLELLNEFVADIEAAYYGEDSERSLADDWPDLHATYEKAKALNESKQ
jgi:hypothetical protein